MRLRPLSKDIIGPVAPFTETFDFSATNRLIAACSCAAASRGSLAVGKRHGREGLEEIDRGYWGDMSVMSHQQINPGPAGPRSSRPARSARRNGSKGCSPTGMTMHGRADSKRERQTATKRVYRHRIWDGGASLKGVPIGRSAPALAEKLDCTIAARRASRRRRGNCGKRWVGPAHLFFPRRGDERRKTVGGLRPWFSLPLSPAPVRAAPLLFGILRTMPRCSFSVIRPRA